MIHETKYLSAQYTDAIGDQKGSQTKRNERKRNRTKHNREKTSDENVTDDLAPKFI